MHADHKVPRPSKRSPLAAVLLSVAATGVGHLYCGRLIKGLILFFLSFAFAPVIVLAAGRAASVWMLGLVLGSLALMLGVFVYAAVDAGLLARRTGADYQPKEYNRWYVYLILIIVSLTYPTNLATSIRENVVQAFKIPSASMAPSILPGDYILLNKAVYKNRSPRRGDVVVFIYPNDRRLYFIKRIAALPGDSIEIRGGVVYINDQPLPLRAMSPDRMPYYAPKNGERLLEETSGKAAYPILVDGTYPDLPKTTVPNGHCFVLGDNRGHSRDSRHFGPVPLSDIRGRLEYIYWPAKSWRRWGKYRY
ncbi:MAG: signal peptidase I [Desulfosarcinaceae bacterium]